MNGSLQPLLEVAGDTLTGERLRMVERAYLTAAHWHRGRRRRNGEPYITHPVAVAAILAELGMDHEVLCAALLHDVLEGTDCPEQALVRDFGEPVVRLVRDMTALQDPRQAPAIWASETGERVLMLKLADRLHNLRTLRWLPEAKRRRTARQTLETFAPVAGRLGLGHLEQELERLAIANLPGGEGVQASFGVISAGATLLPRESRARWLEEWLGELHTLPGRWPRIRFAVQLVSGMPRLAITLRRWDAQDGRHRPGVGAVRGAGLRCLRWVLASDVRTWGLLMPLVAWLVLDTAGERLGDAVTILITVPPVLAAGVRALRARLGDRDGRG
ncbi:HD domain-containing protein [Nonomuraea sp. NPDC049695]|uniref:HD domain-containing protein n=1 Tax=Nonomuraea sp. NPDC049695 TaxID=3154734 RepID=UPI003426A28A